MHGCRGSPLDIHGSPHIYPGKAQMCHSSITSHDSQEGKWVQDPGAPPPEAPSAAVNANSATNTAAWPPCAQCGALVSGRFCGECGAKASNETVNEVVVVDSNTQDDSTRPCHEDFLGRGDPRWRRMLFAGLFWWTFLPVILLVLIFGKVMSGMSVAIESQPLSPKP